MEWAHRTRKSPGEPRPLVPEKRLALRMLGSRPGASLADCWQIRCYGAGSWPRSFVARPTACSFADICQQSASLSPVLLAGILAPAVFWHTPCGAGSRGRGTPGLFRVRCAHSSHDRRFRGACTSRESRLRCVGSRRSGRAGVVVVSGSKSGCNVSGGNTTVGLLGLARLRMTLAASTVARAQRAGRPGYALSLVSHFFFEKGLPFGVSW